MGLIWIRGENGAVSTFSEPLPPGIALRLAAGKLTRMPPPASEPERPAEPPGGAPVPMPGPDAGKPEWERYALSQGMSRHQAHNTKRADLVAHFRRLRSVS